MRASARRSRKRKLQDSLDRRPNLFMGIVDDLGKRIARGDLAPGAQVPVRKALAQHHRTTVVTIQKALALLEASGLVVSRGWRGTFVHQTPPCLHRFGLLMPRKKSDILADTASLYYRPLVQLAEEWQVDHERLAVFGACHDQTNGDLQTLLSELERHTLAGLICVDHDPNTIATLAAEIARRELPCAFLGPRRSHEERLEVLFDHLALARAAFGLLFARGCRRPALVTLVGSTLRKGGIHKAANASGVELSPALIMGFDPEYPEWIASWLQALMALPPRRRPDSFFINDDHLVDGFMKALAAQGMSPKDLPIVTHANLPSPRIPDDVSALCFDLRQALDTAMELIRAARQSGLRKGIRLISPVPAGMAS